MNAKIKNPGKFGKYLKESKNSMNSALETLNKHSDVDDNNTVASKIYQEVKWAHTHIPDASASTNSNIGPINNVKVAVKSMNEAYSKAQFLTGDSVISDAYGHIRRAIDCLNEAMKQIKYDNEINTLIKKVSDLLKR